MAGEDRSDPAGLLRCHLRDLLDRPEAKGWFAQLACGSSRITDRAKVPVAENYRVPLLVVGARVFAGRRYGVSLVLWDLQSIVVSYLTKTGSPPPSYGEVCCRFD